MQTASREILKIHLVYLCCLLLLLAERLLPPVYMESYTSWALLYGIGMEFALTLLPVLVLFCLPCGKTARKRLSFRYPGFLTLFLCLVLSLPLFWTANGIANIHVGWLQLLGGVIATPVLPDPVTPLDYVLAIFYIGLVPAVCEELAFRGFVLTGYRAQYGDAVAIVLSGFLFGLMHGLYYAAPVHIGIGLLLGLVYCMTDSLLPGIVIHFSYNTISLLLPILMNSLTEAPVETGDGLTLAVICILSGISAILIAAGPVIALLFGIRYSAKKKVRRVRPAMEPVSPWVFLPLLISLCIVSAIYLRSLLGMFPLSALNGLLAGLS